MPVDFAYAIHSDVGDHMVAAKVNGDRWRCAPNCAAATWSRSSPPRRPAQPGWLNMVRTGRARSKIRHYLKNMEQEESRAWARRCWPGAARRGQMPSTDPTDTEATALWQQLTRWSGNRHRGELLVDIGLGRKIAIIVAKRLAQLMHERGARPTR